MTKKDYERLATAFQEAYRDASLIGNYSGEATYTKARHGVDFARDSVASALQQDNIRFDRDRFILACQPGANVRARTNMGAK